MALAELYKFPIVRDAMSAFGPAVWRLPADVRRRLCPEHKIPGLSHSRRWSFGRAERVKPPLPYFGGLPTLGHRIAARPYSLPQPFVSEIRRAWLVGQYATPVTTDGRVLMTAFRDQPKMMTLERQDDLHQWVSSQGWRTPRVQPDYQSVCSFINRLDPNYFHWLVEWCGQVEGLRHYQEVTGVLPKILIRAGGPAYLRESLELLGIPSAFILERDPHQEPMLVENLIVPSLPGIRVACSPHSLAWLRRQFLQAAGVDEKIQADRKIYISRKKGGWRSVVNEDEVTAKLEQEGFTILRAENLSLVEQIRLFSQARLIVGLHGAGLTNILFAPQAAMLELFGSYGDGTWYSMAVNLGQQYASIYMQIQNDDVLIDIPSLLVRIKQAEILE